MTHYTAILLTANESLIADFKKNILIISEGWKKRGEVYEIIFSADSSAINSYHFAINRMNSIDCVSLATPRKITAFGSAFDTISRYIDREMVSIARAANCDILIKPHPPAPYRLLISDMDSTMINQECIDELADFVGMKEHVAKITEKAMNGELVFEDALCERVALLKGLDVQILQECFDKRITAMSGAKELIAAFKSQGEKTGNSKAVLVSGGFTFFTQRVAEMLGFDEHYANTLEIENGKLTGKVREPILGKEAKLAELHRQCNLLGITTENVIAIGDGANDLPMLQTAGIGIAYRAKENVQQQLASRINQNDLSSIIHAL